MPRLLACIALVLLFALMAPVASAQVVPTGFNVDTLVSSGLNAPHDFAFLPDGRVLIAERAGAIKLWRPGTSSVTTVGSVPNIQVGTERGLLSIAVRGSDLFCWASRSTTSNMVLSRFTLQGSLNAPTSTNLFFFPTSEYVVLNDAPDSAFNHNGGTIRFGPDGMAYLSIGDDADCLAGTRFGDLKGVLLRLDLNNLPAGAGGPAAKSLITPADNPMVSLPNPNTRLAIARGLRNPFSMCIDPVTGDCYIADVGQNAREELSLWRRTLGSPLVARDFGWPYREGDIAYGGCGVGATPGGLVSPIDVRTSSSGSRSIMCAGVVRNLGGTFDFGPAYERNVFHSDYFNGSIERLEKLTGVPWGNAPSVPGQPSPSFWGTGFTAATHFDMGPDGAIYFVQHSGTYNNSGGSFKRIRGGGPVYNLSFPSGHDQVCTSGEEFGAPLVVKLTNNGGANVANVEVTLTSDDDSASFSPAGPYMTDANGEIVVSVTSTGLGSGPVQVRAFAVGAAPVEAGLYARKLDIAYVPGSSTDQLIVNFSNISNQVNPVLPFVFAVSDAAQPVTPTIFGPLYVNLVTLQDTQVIEDSSGLFGNINLGPVLPFGTPGFASTYTLPAGAYAGQTAVFQALVYDPSIVVSQVGAGATNTGFSNPVSVTFQ